MQQNGNADVFFICILPQSRHLQLIC